MPLLPPGAIDCDVHVSVPGIAALLPYMSRAWREMITTRGTDGLELASFPAGAPITCRPDWRPSNGNPGTDLALLQREVLDGFGSRIAILNCLYGGQAVHSEDLAQTLCQAVNDWLAAEWLEHDARLRASIVVPAQNPSYAAAEIERRAGDARFVQVLLLAGNEIMLGRKYYWPIYEAALKHDLPIGIHGGSAADQLVSGGSGGYVLLDLADVISQATDGGAKLILAGDTQQLQAVENGGGLSLLADALGFVQLTEAVRFRAAWEQAASLRLRDGDTTVLAEYDQHARIVGGEPEQIMDAAAAHYLALTLDGTDVLLMAADHALRRELSRRIRDDLIRLGIVSARPAVRIADGAVASPGDLIVCTRNDHTVEAGEPGRTLANGDLLRIEAVTPGGPIVRRALDADPATGQRQWTGHQFLYSGYGEAELGYAVTDHVAQSRTVHTGLGVIAGTEDRQHAYVVLSRGTDMNMAYVFTVSPKLADPVPGPRPAPELARYDRITAERAAQPSAATAETRDALGALSGVLDRDGEQLSASQTRQQALTDADHLAILHAIWTAETTAAREQQYRDLLAASLPPEYRREPGHQARWLWRTLRAADLAALDVGQVLAAAIGERDLAGARDLAAVIDARLRYRLGAVVPVPAGPWSAQVPAIADPERRAFAAEIAAMMDARKDRIGEYAAEHAPPWAVAALGPVPEDPLDRLDWQRRAASIGAWRELSGHCDPADPIGPEPVAAAPDLRAAWHEALAALAPAAGPDVRGMPDGRLLHLRDTYPIETAWAPQWVGDELRQVRAAAREARLAGLRGGAEAAAAATRGDHETAARQQDLAASATRPCTRPTGSARPCSPRSWPTGPTGTPPPAPSATWLWPPTPNSAAATPISTSPRCVRPNPNPPPKPSGPSSPWPRDSRRARWAGGSPTWPPRTARSPSGSPTGKA